jgi:hypothetical protein
MSEQQGGSILAKAKKPTVTKSAKKVAKSRPATRRPKAPRKAATAAPLRFSLDAMGNGPAVASAVAYQLNMERRWPPNDITKVMSTDYRYDQFTIVNFLNAVQAHLLQGTPSYSFSYDTAFVVQALQLTVAALMNGIASRTH